jgi:single-strand DNA-binding protein
VYETLVTVVGNVMDNPRMRRTEQGTDVASFRIASTARRKDRETGDWVDGNKLYVSVSCWRQLALNAVDSLRKGDPVVISGRLSTREYEKDGQRRSSFELEANALGHDLSRGTTVFHRVRAEPAATFEVIEEEPGADRSLVEPPAEAPEGRVLVAVG